MKTMTILMMLAAVGCGADKESAMPECAADQVTFLRDCDGEWGGEATCVDVAKQPVAGCVTRTPSALTVGPDDPVAMYEFTCVAACPAH